MRPVGAESVSSCFQETNLAATSPASYTDGMRLRNFIFALATLALCESLPACQTADSKIASYPPPPRGSLELPPKEPAKDCAAPEVPEACKHVWNSVAQMTHSYTVPEDGVPTVKLCTPIVCSKCGLVRHECEKELRRRHR
jgi:hypothetical protein